MNRIILIVGCILIGFNISFGQAKSLNSYWLKSYLMNDTVIVNGSSITQDFKGMCLGDVNGSHTPGTGAKSVKVKLNTNNTIQLQANEYYDLPVIIKDNISTSAISLILDYPVNNVDIIDVKVIKNGILYTINTDTNFIYSVINNQLRIGWGMDTIPLNLNTGDTLFKIRIKTSSTFSNGDNIKFDIANNILCEFADEYAIPIENVNIFTKKIKYGNNSSKGENIENKDINIISNAFSSIEIAPNPANEIINIRYSIANSGLVDITLYNLLGEKVSCFVKQQQLSGEHRKTINASYLSPGIYTCKFTLDGKNIIVKKIVISK